MIKTLTRTLLTARLAVHLTVIVERPIHSMAKVHLHSNNISNIHHRDKVTLHKVKAMHPKAKVTRNRATRNRVTRHRATRHRATHSSNRMVKARLP
jgi:hypothetical protein